MNTLDHIGAVRDRLRRQLELYYYIWPEGEMTQIDCDYLYAEWLYNEYKRYKYNEHKINEHKRTEPS